MNHEDDALAAHPRVSVQSLPEPVASKSLDDRRPRKAWVAGMLSQLSPGLGHIYCGHLRTGLVVNLVAYSVLPVGITLLVLMSARWATPLLLAVVFVGFALAFGSSWHSKRLATGLQDYRLGPLNRWWIYVLFVMQVFLWVVPLTLMVRSYMVEAFLISHASMEPGLIQNDLVLADKRQAGDWPVRRGEVIVFRQPENRQQHYVKRAIGLPGDVVEVRADGRVVLNGEPLASASVPGEPPPWLLPHADGVSVSNEVCNGRSYLVLLPPKDSDAVAARFVVPAAHVFVLGDNRAKSKDSRHFGAVPIGDVLGPVTFVPRPAGSWRRFGWIE